jgi:hypothetical protein
MRPYGLRTGNMAWGWWLISVQKPLKLWNPRCSAGDACEGPHGTSRSENWRGSFYKWQRLCTWPTCTSPKNRILLLAISAGSLKSSATFTQAWANTVRAFGETAHMILEHGLIREDRVTSLGKKLYKLRADSLEKVWRGPPTPPPGSHAGGAACEGGACCSAGAGSASGTRAGAYHSHG